MRIRVVERRLRTHGPNALFDITGWAEELAAWAGEGVVLVQAVGSTGALVSLGPSEAEGFRRGLWSLVEVEGWRHPGNAYAHLRSALLGTSLIIPVARGRLLLGGRRVFFVENQPAVARHRLLLLAAASLDSPEDNYTGLI